MAATLRVHSKRPGKNHDPGSCIPGYSAKMGSTCCLHVVISDKAALTRSAARRCAAHGLQVIVSNESTLTITAAVLSPAKCLHVVITDKSTLSRAAIGAGTAHRLHIVISDEPTLTATLTRYGSAVSLHVVITDKAALT
jgi:hypothetical protein